MIIDSFLFFQELDLLEIRLEYLYPFVDKFVIVEAGQTFRGSSKNYNFEKNIKRYHKYLDKIIYHKIEDIHFDYEGLIKFLKKSKLESHKKILRFLEKHNHYNKKDLSHVLDTYHRECIHIVLEKSCNYKDIVIISDLDEIPGYKVFKSINERQITDLMVFIQHEFQYFLNNYSNSNWYGSIIGPYSILNKNSLNELRVNSNILPVISKSGYHFTSIGNKKAIINKIESWAHQEYNHKIIKNNIMENIRNGKDIFYRFKIRNNQYIDINKNKIFDNYITKILSKYDHLFISEIKKSRLFNFKYFFYQILFYLSRIKNNPKRFLKKLFKSK